MAQKQNLMKQLITALNYIKSGVAYTDKCHGIKTTACQISTHKLRLKPQPW